MKIEWIIEPSEVQRVNEFVAEHLDNPFVQRRIKRNLQTPKPPVSRETFWKRHIACLLTSQQRSGPDGSVFRFIAQKEFPLDLTICSECDDVERLCRRTLKAFGGIRMWKIISARAGANLRYLEDDGGWEATFEHLDAVRIESTAETERRAAAFIAEKFDGFGPKQSRNLLQSLGLSQFEVPLDSRVTKWLNEFGFPFKIKASGLADSEYYNLVSAGFQKLAAASGVKPCVLDAAIFASYNDEVWTDEYASVLP